MDEGRQMVSEEKEKQQLKRQTLEFAVKYGGWQKPEENWSVHTLGSRTSSLVHTGRIPCKELTYATPGFPLDLPATPEPVPSPLPVPHKGHEMPSIR